MWRARVVPVKEPASVCATIAAAATSCVPGERIGVGATAGVVCLVVLTMSEGTGRSALVCDGSDSGCALCTVVGTLLRACCCRCVFGHVWRLCAAQDTLAGKEGLYG